MEIRTSEEVRQNIEEFANAYIALLEEKKELDKAIKDLKTEYKENGVAVNLVVKALNQIKAEKKKSDSEKFEEDTIKEWLESNQDIDNRIGILSAK